MSVLRHFEGAFALNASSVTEGFNKKLESRHEKPTGFRTYKHAEIALRRPLFVSDSETVGYCGVSLPLALIRAGFDALWLVASSPADPAPSVLGVREVFSS